jgi:hypothetical protein
MIAGQAFADLLKSERVVESPCRQVIESDFKCHAATALLDRKLFNGCKQFVADTTALKIIVNCQVMNIDNLLGAEGRKTKEADSDAYWLIVVVCKEDAGVWLLAEAGDQTISNLVCQGFALAHRMTSVVVDHGQHIGCLFWVFEIGENYRNVVHGRDARKVFFESDLFEYSFGRGRLFVFCDQLLVDGNGFPKHI